jgi:uncharacterized membrane protein
VNLNRYGLALCVVALIGVWPNAAEANLRFCNRTGAKAHVAIAYVEKDAPGTSTGGDKGVRVEGWWEVEPNQCEVVSNMNAGNHDVFYYASSREGLWQGNSLLCVTSKVFDTGERFKHQGDRCPAGYRLQGFKRIDISTKNYTHNLNPGN